MSKFNPLPTQSRVIREDQNLKKLNSSRTNVEKDVKKSINRAMMLAAASSQKKSISSGMKADVPFDDFLSSKPTPLQSSSDNFSVLHSNFNEEIESSRKYMDVNSQHSATNSTNSSLNENSFEQNESYPIPNSEKILTPLSRRAVNVDEVGDDNDNAWIQHDSLTKSSKNVERDKIIIDRNDYRTHSNTHAHLIKSNQFDLFTELKSSILSAELNSLLSILQESKSKLKDLQSVDSNLDLILMCAVLDFLDKYRWGKVETRGRNWSILKNSKMSIWLTFVIVCIVWAIFVKFVRFESDLLNLYPS